MIELSGLWKKTSQNGGTYYQGRLGQGRLLLFSNQHKKEENHPDLLLYLGQDTSKKDEEKAKETEREEDIPF